MNLPRFSPKAIESFEEVYNFLNIEKIDEIILQLVNPIDVAFAKIWAVIFNLEFMHHTHGKLILDELTDLIENENIDDKIILFLHNCISFGYHFGWLGGSIDIEKAQDHYSKYIKIIPEIKCNDEWEEWFVSTMKLYFDALYKIWRDEDFESALKIHRINLGQWPQSQHPGLYAKILQDTGYFLRMLGRFEKAEVPLYKALTIWEHLRSFWQLWPLTNLTHTNYMRGEIKHAMQFNERAIELTKQFDLPVLTNSILQILFAFKANHLFILGKYNSAIKLYHESLEYAKLTSEPRRIFLALESIFFFYYEQYRIKGENKDFKLAENAIKKLEEFVENNSEQTSLTDELLEIQALLYRYGNIRKKAKSLDILEKLVEKYPNRIRISLKLLEILFEDVIESEDDETLAHIDQLIGRTSDIPLRNNPLAIFEHVSQMILIAKYQYYIKSNVSLAFDTLEELKSHISSYELNYITELVDTEIKVFENEITKWDNLDASIKERIEKSKFNEFIAKGLKIVEQSMYEDLS